MTSMSSKTARRRIYDTTGAEWAGVTTWRHTHTVYQRGHKPIRCMLDDGRLYTREEWDDDADHTWTLDAKGLRRYGQIVDGAWWKAAR